MKSSQGSGAPDFFRFHEFRPVSQAPKKECEYWQSLVQARRLGLSRNEQRNQVLVSQHLAAIVIRIGLKEINAQETVILARALERMAGLATTIKTPNNLIDATAGWIVKMTRPSKHVQQRALGRLEELRQQHFPDAPAIDVSQMSSRQSVGEASVPKPIRRGSVAAQKSVTTVPGPSLQRSGQPEHVWEGRTKPLFVA